MAIERRDDYLTDAQGRALAGAQVYYCTQPANTSVIPPAPLATVYSDTAGDPAANPQITDGFGHAVAYLNTSQLYTVVFVHPLFGVTPVILTDQVVAGLPGAVSINTFAGPLIGTVNGVNQVFVISNGGTPIPNILPTQVTVWCNFPLVNGTGFTVSGNQVTFTTAPHVGDVLFAQGIR